MANIVAMGKRKSKHIQHLVDTEDEDIPVVKNHETVKDWERKNGRGFWGNATTGYYYDEK